MKKQRVVVVGAGIAGSLVTTGLAGRDDVDLICLERVAQADHAEAGTGLNIGPNAMKALKLHLPATAEAIVANSYPWTSWRISTTDGRVLTDLKLDSVADNLGIRIRWSELYSLLRTPLRNNIRYGCKVTGCGKTAAGSYVVYIDSFDGRRSIDNIDLLIAGDGRYSVVREHILGGPDAPFFLGVCLYRVLFPAEDNCPIDDYEQWFSGPNRLLAFRVPGDFIYCAGSFPITANREIPEGMKTPEALGRIYLPPSGKKPSVQAGYLIAKIQQHFDRIHWARLQEGRLTYGNTSGMLLVGDSAHPMVPTLGQGATQACEDACVVVDEIKLALAEGRSLASVSRRVEDRRLDRIQFVVDFSREATDTMLEGADSVAGSLAKAEPPFLEKLARLYRDVPLPLQSVLGR